MSTARQPDPPGESGFALLVVLWTSVLLTLLVSVIAGSGRSDVQLATNLRGAAEAEAAADGAVHAAVFHLLDPATRWAADGRSYTLPLGTARVVVRVEDEAGKINPNLAEPALLQALLQQVGADAQTAARLAEAIADWRFPGKASRLGGDKAAPYRAAGLAYAPPGAPFESVGELRAVLGMTPDLLAAVTPYLTVLTDTAADAALAAPPVQRALRQVLGPPRPLPALPPRTVTIIADAATARGSRFVRRATVRLGATPNERLMQILAWSSA